MRLAASFLLLACAREPSSLVRPDVELDRGTEVSIAELARAPSDLRRHLDQRIRSGEYEEAFFVSELVKNQSLFLLQQLSHNPDATFLATKDERVELADLVAAALAEEELESPERNASLSRALLRLASETAAEQSPVDGLTEPYLADLELFYARREVLPQDPEWSVGALFPISIERAFTYLSPNEALVSLVLLEDGAIAALTVHRRVLYLDVLTISQARAQALAEGLLLGLSDPDTGDAWLNPSSELFAQLLAPALAHVNRSTSRLLVSADGFLCNIPFHLLVEDHTPLLKKMNIINVVSMSHYAALLARPLVDEPPRILALGNPATSYAMPPLPAAEREAELVGGIFRSGVALLASAATEARLKRDAPRFNILHIATHGLLLGSLQPYASSLLLSASSGHDGLLSAAEIAAMELARTQLVVLSACETSVHEGDLGTLTSVSSAFLVAGARTVVGSYWQVNDASTSLLMLRFYDALVSSGVADALRAAQLHLARSERFSHPYYWGAFGVHGSGY